MATIYICGKCLFAFERKGTVDLCPDCGGANIRFATDGEAHEYLRNRDELRASGRSFDADGAALKQDDSSDGSPSSIAIEK